MMKKQIITLTIILGMAMTGFAQSSMFQRENSSNNGTSLYESKGGSSKSGFGPNLPGHGGTGDADAPLGSGIVLLASLGAAYMVAKKRREE